VIALQFGKRADSRVKSNQLRTLLAQWPSPHRANDASARFEFARSPQLARHQGARCETTVVLNGKCC
jgi:hypothetical protein